MTGRNYRDAHSMLEQTANRKPPGMPRRQRYSPALQVTLLLVGLSLGGVAFVWVFRMLARLLWS